MNFSGFELGTLIHINYNVIICTHKTKFQIAIIITEKRLNIFAPHLESPNTFLIKSKKTFPIIGARFPIENIC